MAVWALRRLRGGDAMAAYAQQRQAEHDPAVLEEWGEPPP
jgi:hypothetical protein